MAYVHTHHTQYMFGNLLHALTPTASYQRIHQEMADGLICQQLMPLYWYFRRRFYVLVLFLLSTSKPCRIKYMYTEDGEKVRVSKRSGKVIPKPAELRDRKDWKSRSGYPGGLTTQ